ncbi:unnamed protein product [Blepharisma stoltei]|uniref:Uncharacterized protein n=1 Tax=Blepharisma stoltei TaxID=1481888 RepID=A0AAU9I671_9CILI|nr:unnamed protein product [Blepharisma stoltei]
MEERKEVCEACEAKLEHIQALQEALGEIVDQNEAFRLRVVELEAWVNKANDKLDRREKRISSLNEEIKEAAEKIIGTNNQDANHDSKRSN